MSLFIKLLLRRKIKLKQHREINQYLIHMATY